MLNLECSEGIARRAVPPDWDINDSVVPPVDVYDNFDDWANGHCRLVYSPNCAEARKHSSGWAMRNTNNHNVNILKKSCLGVMVCSKSCVTENGGGVHLRPAICDKARRKQHGVSCPNPACDGHLEIRTCRGHSGYPVTHFWRHTSHGIYFQAKGLHDHPRPEPKSTAQARKGRLKSASRKKSAMNVFSFLEKPFQDTASNAQRTNSSDDHIRMSEAYVDPRNQQLFYNSDVEMQEHPYMTSNTEYQMDAYQPSQESCSAMMVSSRRSVIEWSGNYMEGQYEHQICENPSESISLQPESELQNSSTDHYFQDSLQTAVQPFYGTPPTSTAVASCDYMPTSTNNDWYESVTSWDDSAYPTNCNVPIPVEHYTGYSENEPSGTWAMYDYSQGTVSQNCPQELTFDNAIPSHNTNQYAYNYYDMMRPATTEDPARTINDQPSETQVL